MIKTLLLGLILCLLLPGIVQAHTLETNGSVGAVLHIDPDDDPIIGQSTNLFFEFKDKDHKLTLSKCNCQFEITKNGEPVYATQLSVQSDSQASVSYTFPEKNIYTLKITGNPQTEDLFKPFVLSYSIRVDREAGASQNQSNKGFPFYGVGIGLAGLVGVLIIFFKRKAKH